MGLEIDREQFAPEDYDRFRDRLETCLSVLDSQLARPGFGEGPRSLGAELEMALTDAEAKPLPLNEEVLRETSDERMTFELDRFNLECNLRHVDLAGRPFAHLRNEIDSACAVLARAAAVYDGRIVMIGILPTLVAEDLAATAMTDALRFRALSRSLRAQRRGPFQLHIEGEDSLRLACEDVTFEGAANSFQVHLRVSPRDFTSVFNAAQLATAPILAAAANSPTFLGHRLWDETRVALFKQAVDVRDEGDRLARKPARVNFGTGWLREGAIELFREAVRDYPVLLPVIYEEDPEEALRNGSTPSLKEIRLHQGTVWHWNRPVYDPHDGGHVRVEFRALPSGPTTDDLVANAAFMVGLTLGLAPQMKDLQASFDFELAHHNFYRAAQSGLRAKLDWPAQLGGGDEPIAVSALFPRLAALARAGLREAGVDPAETDPLIECVLERVECGRTGASWQRASLAHHTSRRSSSEAYAAMLQDYLRLSTAGEPVHRWEVS